MQRIKIVIDLGTLHSSVFISEENNPKKKPQFVLFYHKTKFGVDVLDQMTRIYSVKAASRQWPVHVLFYNIIDLALIKSWIVYKNVCKLSTFRRKYIQKISEELTGNVPNSTKQKTEKTENYSPAKCRRTWLTKQCKNRTTDVWNNCVKPVGGKCAKKRCRLCIS